MRKNVFMMERTWGTDPMCEKCGIHFGAGDIYVGTPEGVLCPDCFKDVYINEIYDGEEEGDEGKYDGDEWAFAEDREDMEICEFYVDGYGVINGYGY